MNKYKNEWIDCTGDACTGDFVSFERAVFTGSYPNSKFSHLEKVEGEIIKDSYGKDKQQHTFTLLVNDSKIRIKGRNLYRNGTKRKLWEDEEKRKDFLNEKHQRGEAARAAAAERKNYNFYGSRDNDGNCCYCGASNGHFNGCAGIIYR